MDESRHIELREMQAQLNQALAGRSVSVAMSALIAELASVTACLDIPDNLVRPLVASIMGQFQEAVAKARACRPAPPTT